MKYSIEEREPVCANCHYYYQHHVQYDGVYVPAHCGHCAAIEKRRERFWLDYFGLEDINEKGE